MSELEARKYISIYNLKAEIRQDMGDYKLLCSRIPDKDGNEYIRIFGDEEHYRFFRIYLMNKIEENIKKLKELMEDKND